MSLAIAKGFCFGEGLRAGSCRNIYGPVDIIPVVEVRFTMRFTFCPHLHVLIVIGLARLRTGLGWGPVSRAPGLGLVGCRTGAWWSRSCKTRIHGSLETELLAKESIGARHIPFSANR